MFDFYKIKNLNQYIDNEISKILHKTNKKTILVLSGGGIKGLGHIGALKALDEYDLLKNINVVSSVSIGAIISYLYLIGYNPDEMEKFIMSFDLTEIIALEMNIMKNYGIDNGDKLIGLLVQLTKNKNVNPLITYKELYEMTHIEFITATCCINTKSICYMSYKNEPDLPVLTGVRMSFSFPIYFTPIYHKEMLYIDGGCIDNYPIHIFSERKEEVLGIYLNEQMNTIKEFCGLETYLINIVLCLLEGINVNATKGYEKQTIKVNIPVINFMDFNVDYSKKQEFIKIGYYTTVKFLSKSKIL
jgi:NTE family protein